MGHDAAQLGDGRRGGRLPPRSRTTTRSWPRPSARAARAASGRGAGAADEGPPGRPIAGTNGKTTTTSMMTDARSTPAQIRRSPLAGTGRDRLRRPPRQRAELRGRGRRERQDVPAVHAVGRDGHQHRGRPPRHLRHLGRTEAAFAEFADRVTDDGFLVACVETPALPTSRPWPRRAASAVAWASRRRRRPTPRRGLEFAGGTSRFTVVYRGRRLGEVSLQILAGTTCSTPWRRWVPDCGWGSPSRTCPGARGVQRHPPANGYQGEAARVRVCDEHAHHPNEIAGDLQAARSLAARAGSSSPSSRTWCPARRSSDRRWAGARGRRRGRRDGRVRRREDPEPGVNGRLVASHVPLPPGDTSSSEPSWSRTPSRCWSSAPGPGTW